MTQKSFPKKSPLLILARITSTLEGYTTVCFTRRTQKNKEERYSRVPRISDTRYSAKGAKGKWRYAQIVGVKMGVANFLFQSIGIDETKKTSFLP